MIGKRVIKILAGAGLCALMITAYAGAGLFEIMQVLTLAQISVIFGEDDRLDFYQLKNPNLRQAADSTVALFSAKNVKFPFFEPGTARLSTRHYGKTDNLCEEEPFYDQPKGAFCSGVLIAPDIVLTAGHCIETESSCKKTRFVFGFAIYTKDKYPDTVLKSDVYECKDIRARYYASDHEAEFALIQLDRKVSGRIPLKLNLSGKIEKDTPLIVIGHPKGLPVKIAGNAKVLDHRPMSTYFIANPDTYTGSSGSPIFNANTLLIEGIAARAPEPHFILKEDCNISRVTSDSGKSEPDGKLAGVEVSKAEFLSLFLEDALDPDLPALTEDKAADIADMGRRKMYMDEYIRIADGRAKHCADHPSQARINSIMRNLHRARFHAVELGPEHEEQVDKKAEEIMQKCGEFDYPNLPD
ncbi:trypsin-like serine peptidase [Elusimicrobiota bacterium]